MKNYPKLKKVTALNNYRLLLVFSNGEEKVYDFTKDLNHPYYKDLRNVTLFKKVTVNNGEIEWVTGQDFCPHTLYEKSTNHV